jgi:hypothetical protein
VPLADDEGVALLPRLVGEDAGSVFTGRRPLLGVACGPDADDLDLDGEPDDEDDAMRRGIQELL